MNRKTNKIRTSSLALFIAGVLIFICGIIVFIFDRTPQNFVCTLIMCISGIALILAAMIHDFALKSQRMRGINSKEENGFSDKE